MLFGTVGLFDLRVLGLLKRIPIGALHRLVPFGLAGYALNLLTGLAFFSAHPDQYAYNSAFWWKLGVHVTGRRQCRRLLYDGVQASCATCRRKRQHRGSREC